MRVVSPERRRTFVLFARPDVELLEMGAREIRENLDANLCFIYDTKGGSSDQIWGRAVCFLALQEFAEGTPVS